MRTELGVSIEEFIAKANSFARHANILKDVMDSPIPLPKAMVIVKKELKLMDSLTYDMLPVKNDE